MALRSLMASWYSGGPTVAQPFVNGCANNKTLLRRLQRKHTQASYRHMQTRLLCLVKPMPKGVYSTDLESFRRSLYTEKDAKTDAEIQSTCITCNLCNWCGIWTPLPPDRKFITAKITENNGTNLERSLESSLAKLDSVVDTLLDACLCQSQLVEEVIHIEGYVAPAECFTVAEASERSWHSNDKPGWKKYCFKRSHHAVEDPNTIGTRSANFLTDYTYDFKRTRALFEAEVPEALPSASSSPRPGQYYTDESTGECKSQ